MSEDWKKRFEETRALLQEKERALKSYQEAIQEITDTMKEVTQKLSLDFKLVNQIHRILLPVDLPIIPGCEFSFKFYPADIKSESKDFYEVLPHPATKSFSIIMSSCSSHSLSALMFSARLKMMNRGERIDHLKPHEFVACLRKEINRDSEDLSGTGMNLSNILEEKVSLFYALVSQKTYQMFYCLVGDISALTCYSETRQMEELKQGAKGLKADEVKNLKTQTISLNSRDRLILCSPGVLNCQSPNGDTYPLSALKKSLKTEEASTVHEVRNRILYELESFAQGRPLKRDQSILVMEVKNQILKLAKNE